MAAKPNMNRWQDCKFGMFILHPTARILTSWPPCIPGMKKRAGANWASGPSRPAASWTIWKPGRIWILPAYA